ncbi:MAG TPA: isoprenylcysteine carboxylmethyltransferase family protein [Bacteroidota bacterium]|nr:isoprenylcysteine carboxylmethyltransferase family protein [Bacteroidota bacterium]
MTIYQELTILLWIAHEILWGLLSRGNKETAVMGRRAPRTIALIGIGLGFILLYTPKSVLGTIATSVLPESGLVEGLGLAICVIGLLFAWWARKTLGTNWSGEVTIKKDHELIERGPYTVVRHPIYTGLIIAFLGTAVAMTRLSGFVGAALMFIGILAKVKEEETLLASQFVSYDNYCRRVRKIIPYLY